MSWIMTTQNPKCPCNCCQDLASGCNCEDYSEPEQCDCAYCIHTVDFTAWPQDYQISTDVCHQSRCPLRNADGRCHLRQGHPGRCDPTGKSHLEPDLHVQWPQKFRTTIDDCKDSPCPPDPEKLCHLKEGHPGRCDPTGKSHLEPNLGGDMATIIFTPDQHDCQAELHKEIGLMQPAGTTAECSCGRIYVFWESQFDGRYWKLSGS